MRERSESRASTLSFCHFGHSICVKLTPSKKDLLDVLKRPSNIVHALPRSIRIDLRVRK